MSMDVASSSLIGGWVGLALKIRFRGALGTARAKGFAWI